MTLFALFRGFKQPVDPESVQRDGLGVDWLLEALERVDRVICLPHVLRFLPRNIEDHAVVGNKDSLYLFRTGATTTQTSLTRVGLPVRHVTVLLLR